MWLDALSTRGPLTPKWVNSISPVPQTPALFLESNTFKVTLRSERPIMAAQ